MVCRDHKGLEPYPQNYNLPAPTRPFAHPKPTTNSIGPLSFSSWLSRNSLIVK
jgi:hypothetical protein